ncbi:ATP-dependent DNA helicase PIF1 [Lecanosticta acicola]|uniref:ATP-dependent DNA helicase PIF1 n=1 Tax=Lecanosticta acicola TaxID=111012 RepID=A0AAI8YTU8_9PEZI|nr:ATP-dependent DNA helicase PIF1 [Lecanosticta acicola]
MLQSAVHKHAQKHGQQQRASQSSLATVQGAAFQKPSSQSTNPGYRNPLHPTSDSTLNGLKSDQPYPSRGGVKRTASGLAKAFDGSFEDATGSQNQSIMIGARSPSKSKVPQVTQTDLFDEDDFDSDIELDVEEPVPQKAVSYPKLPGQSSNFAVPTKPTANSTVSYPELPGTAQASTYRPTYQSREASTAADSGYGTANPPASQQAPGSSAPLPWSSSPVTHYSPKRPIPSLQHFALDPYSSTHIEQDTSPRPGPAKRRTIPWMDKNSEDDASEPAASSTSTARTTSASTARSMATPRDRTKKDKPSHLWNTTASAVKEQQKKHREEARKVRNQEGTEESLRKAKGTHKRPARVFLSEEQQHVLELVIEKKKSVFFTGSAGTGKSVLMREIIASLRKKYSREPDRVAVTASTGLAACNVGGVTVHSFAGIGLGKEEVPELVKKIKRNQKAKHRWMRTKVLVVDEVSMVDGDLFDKLESIARQIRNNARPFGGIQLVITGDFFQLPPVPENNRAAKFAFDAATWTTSVEHTIGLHHVFRQKDPVFAGMLNEMREGRLSQSSINVFKTLNRDLNFEDSLDATELFPTRQEVDRANSQRLAILQGDTLPFPARDGGSITDKAMRDKLLSNCLAPELITLKKGAQVMLIKNIDETLVNGSLGRVIGFMDERKFDSYNNNEAAFSQSPGGTIESEEGGGSKLRLMAGVSTSMQWPLVRFAIADGTWRDLLCEPETWKVELPNGEVQASRVQVPLILAWALSIHKAQGQTLERVKVDLGKVFEKGQAYVALSRATSMAGLQVLRFDPRKVNAHERVRTFYSQLARVELAEKNKERMEKIDKPQTTTTADDYEKRFIEGDVGWGEM